jgi:hypothetical protein
MKNSVETEGTARTTFRPKAPWRPAGGTLNATGVESLPCGYIRIVDVERHTRNQIRACRDQVPPKSTRLVTRFTGVGVRALKIALTDQSRSTAPAKRLTASVGMSYVAAAENE